MYLCAVVLGTDRPFLLIVFVFATSSLVGLVSILPGGIGAVEAGLAGQFVAVAGLAVAFTLIIRQATLWFATLVGIVGLFAERTLLGPSPEP